MTRTRSFHSKRGYCRVTCSSPNSIFSVKTNPRENLKETLNITTGQLAPIKTCSEAAEKHDPIKSRRVKCINKPPWITSELTELMRERDYHQKQAHKTNSEYHWAKFRQLRNLVNKQIKLGKSKYYQECRKFWSGPNPSGLWKTLNELTSRNVSRQNPSCIISEGVPETDEKSIATILNDYFTSIGAKLANKIKHAFGTKHRQHPLIFPIFLSSKK